MIFWFNCLALKANLIVLFISSLINILKKTPSFKKYIYDIVFVYSKPITPVWLKKD